MPESKRKLTYLLAILLFAGTALLYAPAVRNGFVNYDDPDYVTQNRVVLGGLTWHGVIWSFGTDNAAANWHPLTWISHMVDVSWYGAHPFGHHLTNVILHCLGVALLFLVLQRATGMALRSGAVAALFALHPLNVESVAWVAERKAVLCFVFLVLTLWAYIWYAKKPGIARGLLVAILFAFALMSKIMVITLPFALVLLDYWPLGRISGQQARNAAFAAAAPNADAAAGNQPASRTTLRTSILEKVPLFALSAAAGWITLHIHRSKGALTGAMPFSWRFKNAAYSYLFYLGKAIWPSNLSVFYPHPQNSLPAWKVVVAIVVIAGVSAAVWGFREKRYLVVGWLWFLGTMVPMCGIVQSGRQAAADRYMYIPILGLLIGVVWLSADLAAKFEVRLGVTASCFALLAAPYCYVTHRQIGYWHDSYTLFSHALQVTQNNAVAENNFGAALMELGQPQLAAPHFVAAVRLAPDITSAHYNLGVLLQGQNNLEAAAQQYKFVIAESIDPIERTRSHNNLGALYLTTNNYPAALVEFNAAIALNPSEQNSYIGRGIIELRFRNLDGAVADFSRAAQMAPSPIADFHLGEALETKGDYPRAELAYAAALQLSPGFTQARAQLEALHGKSSTSARQPEAEK